MARRASVPVADWQSDPSDPDLLRWHDGQQLTDQVKSKLVHQAETQTRLLTQLANDVSTIKSIVLALVVVFILGALVGVLIAVVSSQ